MRSAICGLAIVWFFSEVSAVHGGMGAPLPMIVQKILRLSDTAVMRLQSISFFLLGFAVCSAAIMFLWNSLRRDFPALPRITFPKAAVVVFLWGLLFIIVLTMIGGARELMTPGAWKKNGITYQLRGDEAASPSRETIHRQHLEKLRTALWQFAATHQGRFPSTDEMSAIASEHWLVPDAAGMRYFYVPNLSASHAPEVLAYEPELEPGQRLVLKTNGDILLVPSAQIPVTQAAKP